MHVRPILVVLAVTIAAAAGEATAETGDVGNGKAINGKAINGKAINGPEMASLMLAGGVGGYTNIYLENSKIWACPWWGWWYCTDQLVGATINATTVDSTGNPSGTIPLTIQSFGPGPDDPDLTLYELTTQVTYWWFWYDPWYGGWWIPYTVNENVCGDGGRAIPITGQWDYHWGRRGDGGFAHWGDAYAPVYSFACNTGAIGKCIEKLDYKLWNDPNPYDPNTQWDWWLWYDYARPVGRDRLETCVRAVTGDYCGNNTSLTQDGTYIDLVDSYEPQVNQRDTMLWGLEATWTAEGAACVDSARWTQIVIDHGGTENHCLCTDFDGYCYAEPAPMSGTTPSGSDSAPLYQNNGYYTVPFTPGACVVGFEQQYDYSSTLDITRMPL